MMRVCSQEVLCRVPTTLRRLPTSGKTVVPETGLSSAERAGDLVTLMSANPDK